MAHRKEEYDAGGHEIVIQQVNPDSDVYAWIDGYAAHTSEAIQAFVSSGPLSLAEKVDSLRGSGETWKAIETLVAFMVDTDVYFCKKCNTFYNFTDVASTGFAGHQCGDCAQDAARCPDNPDGDNHEDECLNPRQKRNARVATKYKCVHCGRNRQTVPTG